MSSADLCSLCTKTIKTEHKTAVAKVNSSNRTEKASFATVAETFRQSVVVFNITVYHKSIARQNIYL